MRSYRLFLRSLGMAMIWSTLPLFAQSLKQSTVEYDRGDLPEVITRSPQVVQEAWKRVSSELVGTESPERHAELLIRRGYLLLSVHARTRAYLDFRQAGKLYVDLGASDEEIRDRTVAFLRLLKQGRTQFPPTPSHKDGGLNEYYGVGYHHFWRGDYNQALEYFEKALDLEPYEPTSHYYRALCYRCSSEQSAAEEAVRNAAFWEFQSLRASYGHPPSNAPSRVNRALERVQGRTRLWLEAYRPSKSLAAIDTPQQWFRAFADHQQ